MRADRSHDVLVKNNIFYNGERTLVGIVDGKNNKFIDNALIYVRRREQEAIGMANWAFLGDFVSKTNYWSIDEVQISGNVGQGSEDTGFSFMAGPC